MPNSSAPLISTNIAQETGGHLATIDTSTAAGATSANQTNGTQQVKLTDGTNVAAISVGDFKGVETNVNSQTFAMSLTGAQSASAVLPIVASGNSYENPGGNNPSTQLFIDMRGYAGGSIAVTSLGTGITTVTFKTGNDSTNFFASSFSNASIPLSAPVSGGAVSTLYDIPNDVMAVQLSLNGTQTTGTTTVKVHLKATSSSRPGTVIQTGSNAIGSLSAGAAAIGTVSLTSSSSNGVSTFGNNALTSTGVQIKSTAGGLYDFTLFNPSIATTYFQFFLLPSASVTVGTTAPSLVIGVAAGATVTQALTVPRTGGTGLTICATTTPTGSTAPATAAVVTVGFV